MMAEVYSPSFRRLEWISILSCYLALQLGWTTSMRQSYMMVHLHVQAVGSSSELHLSKHSKPVDFILLRFQQRVLQMLTSLAANGQCWSSGFSSRRAR